ncbi:Protein of unknown function [Gryllus bimaculatus]|nr:Protein of unknown function [Gryllus bimaculatus]
MPSNNFHTSRPCDRGQDARDSGEAPAAAVAAGRGWRGGGGVEVRACGIRSVEWSRGPGQVREPGATAAAAAAATAVLATSDNRTSTPGQQRRPFHQRSRRQSTPSALSSALAFLPSPSSPPPSPPSREAAAPEAVQSRRTASRPPEVSRRTVLPVSSAQPLPQII